MATSLTANRHFVVTDDAQLIAVDLLSYEVTSVREHVAHGPATCVCSMEARGVPLVVTGGTDGVVRFWREDADLEPVVFALDSPLTAFAAGSEVLLAGTMEGVVALDVTGAVAVR